jgi:putative DNA primase/helicase
MLHHAALHLARKGLHVFPCRVRGKQPATTNGFKDASRDPEVVTRWWSLGPSYNIGVATGAGSGVFVLDVDGGERAGEASLRALEAEHGALPATVESITGGGRHLWFKMPGRSVPCSVDRVGPGLDVRGAGGYVVAPPSIHPSGRAYSWSVDSGATFADAPAWLLERACLPTTNGDPDGKVLPAPVGDWRDIVITGVGEGARDNSAARLAGYLLRHRIDPLVTLGLLQAWNETKCSPPLATTDIERVVNSIAGRELERRSNS